MTLPRKSGVSKAKKKKPATAPKSIPQARKESKKARLAKKLPATKRLEPKKRGGIGKDDGQKYEKAGQPTAYKPEYNKIAYRMCLLGATDKELAAAFDVAESTINNWKIAHPEFLESMSDGRERADAHIAEAMYHRAKGYSHPEVHVSNYQGQITLTPLIKHYPPDTPAASLWLRNRQPDKWRDRQEITGADGGAQKFEVTHVKSPEEIAAGNKLRELLSGGV